MNRIQVLLAALLVLPLLACVKANERPIDTASITTAPSTTTSAPEPAPQPEWVVTEHGIGKLRAGMTLADARGLFPSFKVPGVPIAPAAITRALTACRPALR